LESELEWATVRTFARSRGIGSLLTRSGQVLRFDVSPLGRRDFRRGDPVEVKVANGHIGQPKDRRITFAVDEQRDPEFATGFRRLKELGFLRRLELRAAKARAKALFGALPQPLNRGHAGALLRDYYGDGISERGRAEGVITLGWRFGEVTQQPVEDLYAITQGACTVRFRYGVSTVVVGNDVEADLSEGLLPLLDAINLKLAGRDAAGRFFSLDCDDDYYVIAYRPADFAQAVKAARFLRLS
jgi:hypothetical protein